MGFLDKLFGSTASGEAGLAAYDRKDYATAIKLLRPLAGAGNASVQALMGGMYNEGQGVPQDYKEAVKWWRLAAEQGAADAQFNLGAMYAKGQGVLQDYAYAHMWYSLASAAGGSKYAAINRHMVATQMTPQQIEKAQEMAKAYQASNFKGC